MDDDIPCSSGVESSWNVLDPEAVGISDQSDDYIPNTYPLQSDSLTSLQLLSPYEDNVQQSSDGQAENFNSTYATVSNLPVGCERCQNMKDSCLRSVNSLFRVAKGSEDNRKLKEENDELRRVIGDTNSFVEDRLKECFNLKNELTVAKIEADQAKQREKDLQKQNAILESKSLESREHANAANTWKEKYVRCATVVEELQKKRLSLNESLKKAFDIAASNKNLVSARNVEIEMLKREKKASKEKSKFLKEFALKVYKALDELQPVISNSNVRVPSQTSKRFHNLLDPVYRSKILDSSTTSILPTSSVLPDEHEIGSLSESGSDEELLHQNIDPPVQVNNVAKNINTEVTSKKPRSTGESIKRTREASHKPNKASFSPVDLDMAMNLQIRKKLSCANTANEFTPTVTNTIHGKKTKSVAEIQRDRLKESGGVGTIVERLKLDRDSKNKKASTSNSLGKKDDHVSTKSKEDDDVSSHRKESSIIASTSEEDRPVNLLEPESVADLEFEDHDVSHNVPQSVGVAESPEKEGSLPVETEVEVPLLQNDVRETQTSVNQLDTTQAITSKIPGKDSLKTADVSIHLNTATSSNESVLPSPVYPSEETLSVANSRKAHSKHVVAPENISPDIGEDTQGTKLSNSSDMLTEKVNSHGASKLLSEDVASSVPDKTSPRMLLDSSDVSDTKILQPKRIQSIPAKQDVSENRSDTRRVQKLITLSTSANNDIQPETKRSLSIMHKLNSEVENIVTYPDEWKTRGLLVSPKTLVVEIRKDDPIDDEEVVEENVVCSNQPSTSSAENPVVYVSDTNQDSSRKKTSISVPGVTLKQKVEKETLRPTPSTHKQCSIDLDEESSNLTIADAGMETANETPVVEKIIDKNSSSSNVLDDDASSIILPDSLRPRPNKNRTAESQSVSSNLSKTPQLPTTTGGRRGGRMERTRSTVPRTCPALSLQRIRSNTRVCAAKKKDLPIASEIPTEKPIETSEVAEEDYSVPEPRVSRLRSGRKSSVISNDLSASTLESPKRAVVQPVKTNSSTNSKKVESSVNSRSVGSRSSVRLSSSGSNNPKSVSDKKSTKAVKPVAVKLTTPSTARKRKLNEPSSAPDPVPVKIQPKQRHRRNEALSTGSKCQNNIRGALESGLVNSCEVVERLFTEDEIAEIAGMDVTEYCQEVIKFLLERTKADQFFQVKQMYISKKISELPNREEEAILNTAYHFAPQNQRLWFTLSSLLVQTICRQETLDIPSCSSYIRILCHSLSFDEAHNVSEESRTTDEERESLVTSLFSVLLFKHRDGVLQTLLFWLLSKSRELLKIFTSEERETERRLLVCSLTQQESAMLKWFWNSVFPEGPSLNLEGGAFDWLAETKRAVKSVISFSSFNQKSYDTLRLEIAESLALLSAMCTSPSLAPEQAKKIRNDICEDMQNAISDIMDVVVKQKTKSSETELFKCVGESSVSLIGNYEIVLYRFWSYISIASVALTSKDPISKRQYQENTALSFDEARKTLYALERLEDRPEEMTLYKIVLTEFLTFGECLTSQSLLKF